MRNAFINELERMLHQYTKIFLYCSNDFCGLRLFCAELEKREIKDFMVLYHMDSNYNNMNKNTMGIAYDEFHELLKFYKSYDFSDKIVLVSENAQYGSLFNLVKTGILSKQEMVEALLYEI